MSVVLQGRAIGILFFTLVAALSSAQSIAEKTKGLTGRAGLIESFVDREKGKVMLKLAPPNKEGVSGEYLYVEALETGLGSNDLGLDRTQFGDTYVIRIRPVGDKALFEIPNLNFRADTENPDERRAVEEGFAKSIFWATPIVARDPDGSVLIDVSDLLLKDVHKVSQALEDQGGYSLDKDRSVILTDQCKAFPENLEFESLLTYRSVKPGSAVAAHAPDPQSITLTQRQSLIKLPDSGYKPRRFDPRSGCFSVDYLNFAAPLDQPLLTQLICRHRLEKTNPNAARSTVKKPIVYYVDRGVPEPVRSALIEGGNYWREAFDAAGFIDAFRVELMPEGADPMDLRYNVVQWMNRSTRGWAYGQSVVDPRTGEILKGAVNLDSQRSRQDILIFESLLGVEGTGKGGPNDPIQVALSRVRQLGAHEIGHTLGFQHNFAGSRLDRASVMDYPAPRITVRAGDEIDLSNAYAKGVGAWDIQAVRYAYSEFPQGADEARELEKIVQGGLSKGLLFLSDDDANEANGASPIVNRWDDLADPLQDLANSLRIREIAMKRFGERNLRVGQPLASLELVFGPLYFFHRYDVDSVAKMVGGQYYTHVVRGDGQPAATPVPGNAQRRAISALLGCLNPSVLSVPSSISKLMGPWPNGLPESGERFRGRTPFAFDTVSAAASGADLVLSRLLNPGRCSRIVELASRDSSLPGLDTVLSATVQSVLRTPVGSVMEHEIWWSVQHVLVSRLIELADSDQANPTVRARARKAIEEMLGAEKGLENTDTTGNAQMIASELTAYLSRPLVPGGRAPAPLPALPGSPIGAFACDGW